MQIVRQVLQFILIVLGLGLLFAWLGVYDTADLSFVDRTVFWSTTMATGAGSSLLIAPRLWSDDNAWPVWLRIGAVAAFVSVPVTFVLFAFSGWSSSLAYILVQYGYVFVISLIVTAGTYVVTLLRSDTSDAAETGDPTARFRERLPVRLRTATIFAVSSEDHYVRVFTDLGDDLILMRIADAVRELSGVAGAQVHRSWWVAREAVADEKRVNGRRFVVLKSGLDVPVSRGFQAAARAAGLIS